MVGALHDAAQPLTVLYSKDVANFMGHCLETKRLELEFIDSILENSRHPSYCVIVEVTTQC